MTVWSVCPATCTRADKRLGYDETRQDASNTRRQSHMMIQYDSSLCSTLGVRPHARASVGSSACLQRVRFVALSLQCWREGSDLSLLLSRPHW